MEVKVLASETKTLHVYTAISVFDMATREDDYENIYQFLQYGKYPEDMDKNQKRNFRRKAKDNYKLDKGILYYHQRGSSEWKQVPRSWKDRKRILASCHASAEGKGQFVADFYGVCL